jgi:mono/diheme cytochrome c family protein
MHGGEGLFRWLPAVSIAVAISVSLVVGACGGDDGAGSDATVPAELEEGRDIYVSRCATCHGRDGDGGVGPALADGRVVERYPDIADHLEIVREGRNAMPAWEGELTPEEIEAVVRYEREGL